VGDGSWDSVSAEKVIGTSVDPEGTWSYRAGGLSAIALAVGYIATIPLYAYVGAPPTGGEAWLTYAAGKTNVWWAIFGLSVITDFLFVPVAFALYLALKGVNRGAMLVATAFVGLFVVLDLAVTWSHYAVLIALTGDYAAATTEAQRAAYVAAANLAAAVLTFSLAVYSILVPSLGILMVGLVMLRGGVFGKGIAYLGVVTGVLGIISVAGPLLVSALSATIIVTSLLTTVWVLLVGYRLLRLG
jgi:hypothetical protein